MNKKEVVSQLISAIAYIAAGLVVTLHPGASAKLICTGIGVCALAYGAFCLLFYFIRRGEDDVSRFTMPMGIAFAALGAFCLIAPKAVLSVIPLLLGIVLLIDGAGKLGRALELRRIGFARWSMLACVAAVIIIFGVTLVAQPYAAAEGVLRTFGALLAADGAIELYFTFRIYRLGKDR